jgi:hypothetical protein
MFGKQLNNALVVIKNFYFGVFLVTLLTYRNYLTTIFPS